MAGIADIKEGSKAIAAAAKMGCCWMRISLSAAMGLGTILHSAGCHGESLLKSFLLFYPLP